jgi:hypothetical protein
MVKMSESKQRQTTTARFLTHHPFCCFCGGACRASTREHYPPRRLFADKDRPDDFVFPACKPCNEMSRQSDLVVSFLALSTHRHKFDGDLESKKMAEAIRKNCPQSHYELQGGRTGTRTRERAIQTRTGQPWVLLKIGAFTKAHVRLVTRKMISAGYYRMTGGSYLPLNSWIFIGIHTSTNLFEDKLPDLDGFGLGEFITLRQGRKEKEEQFGLRASISSNKELSIFQYYLHNQFLITALVITNNDVFVSLTAEQQAGYVHIGSITPPIETPLNDIQRLNLR